MNELQKRLIAIQQEIHAPKSEYNKFGGFAYRNVEAIYQALKSLLIKYECALTLSDSIELIGDRFYIKATATISHNGENLSVSAYARESIDKKGMDSAQITGACSSYARKYALGGLFLIDDNKDFDSMDNSEPQAQQSAPRPQKAQEVTLAAQVTHELRAIGLSNSDIRKYMNYRGLKSTDNAGLRAWLDDIENSLQDAIAFMSFVVANKNLEAQNA